MEYLIDKKYLVYSFFLFLSIISLSGCGKENTVNYKLSNAISPDSLASIKKVNLFIETSASMQGYVNANIPGKYILKEVLPYIIIDLDNQYKDATNIYTITDQSRKIGMERKAFFRELTSGSIFGGKSSKLQDVFSAVIDSIDDASVNIIVSDCISDLGNVNTMTEGPKVSQTIYSHLSQKSDIGAVVFQYLSDFNGTYYYDRNNTGGRNMKSRPYYNTILHNRPLYIWVVGKKELVSELLGYVDFGDFKNSHYYNIPLIDTNPKLLENPKKGKISINREKQILKIKEASVKRPVEFVVGVNFNNKSSYDAYEFFNKESFDIKPEFLAKDISLEIFDSSFIDEKEVDKNFIQKNKLNGFIQVSLSAIESNVEEFSIFIQGGEAKWYNQTHLNDDFQISAESLEGKTFAFKYITDAFDRYFKNQPPLLQLNFVKQNK